jgi:hypothetical protein
VGPGFFPASAANEAADDTSGQRPRAAVRLSAVTVLQISPRRVFSEFNCFFIYIFSSFRGELLSQTQSNNKNPSVSF